MGMGEVLEAAVVAPVTNRTTLPYYRPPSRSRAGMGSTISEAMVPEGVLESMTLEALPDVAAASFAETLVLEAIIGNDDRVRVADNLMRANPWRQICALRIRSKTGKMYVGTGWFIAPRVLATAGHCVFLQNEGGWAKSIDVIPAKAGVMEVFGKSTSGRFRAVDGWVKDQSRDFDYGVIVLDGAELGTRLGNFSVRTFNDASLKGAEAKISGYPADRDRAEYQYFHERPLQSTTNTRLNYDIDTFGGQSGSPIWIDTYEHGLVAVGVHTTGGLSSNSGTRINLDVLSNLVSWIREA
jgi:V8-like Glu-specific endopeptidase